MSGSSDGRLLSPREAGCQKCGRENAVHFAFSVIGYDFRQLRLNKRRWNAGLQRRNLNKGGDFGDFEPIKEVIGVF